MKKLLIAAFVLLSPLVQAQKLDNALLWKISGNGLTAPSYLFGTIHVSCNVALDKNVMDALNTTEQLYLELDMDDPKMVEKMGSLMMMDGDKTMQGFVTPDEFRQLDEFLQNTTGISATMVNRLKPAMVSTMLMPKMIDCPIQSFEGELVKVAQDQKKEIYGLETVEYQMGVFDAIPYQEQMNELLKTAQNGIEKDKSEFNQMIELYTAKNITGLLQLMEKSDNKMYSKYNDIFLVKRNKNWIPIIIATAKKSPTFFGVGAAHLAGKDGVILLLRKQGYKVEAVK